MSADKSTVPSSKIITLDQHDMDVIATVQSLANRIKKMMADSILVEGVDYGVIPNTGDKPTLYLPGMEKFMRMLNAEPIFIDRRMIVDYDRPLFHYEYECRLMELDTQKTVPGGRGLGLCHSMESAFAWRWVSEVDIPPNLDKSQLEARNDVFTEPDFAIRNKQTSGKYGKPLAYWDAFEKGIADGTAQVVIRKDKNGKDMRCYAVGGIKYRIPNIDIFDQINNIMKRAKKRALADAVKGAANVSGFFTSDLEDFADYTQYRFVNTDGVIDGELVEDDKPTPPPNVTTLQQPASNPPAVSQPENEPEEKIPEWVTISNIKTAIAGLHNKGMTDPEIIRIIMGKSLFDVAAWGKWNTGKDAIATVLSTWEAEQARTPPATPKANGNGQPALTPEQEVKKTDLVAQGVIQEGMTPEQIISLVSGAMALDKSTQPKTRYINATITRIFVANDGSMANKHRLDLTVRETTGETRAIKEATGELYYTRGYFTREQLATVGAAYDTQIPCQIYQSNGSWYVRYDSLPALPIKINDDGVITDAPPVTPDDWMEDSPEGDTQPDPKA